MSSRLSDPIQETIHKSRQCLEQGTSEDYETLHNLFRRLESLAREELQTKFRREARQISDKLEKGRTLSPTERETLELLMIGAARAYLALEADFDLWKAKVERLTSEVEALDANELAGEQQLLRLQALCLQGYSVLSNLTYYLRERERVDRFENSLSASLDAQSGKFLAEVLRGMMQSVRL